ncbi:hypothetical protein ARMSODRAFT_951133 [Armillaria solidipes]|uniref:Protein kinase domain-containing protein n=1 Tax=Armillaria solidipes TaxID=1076256 RepID=A0A2H3CE48_9AGAR|nr:hypothetical protein ARMSODRAFT_951133 [Armillaria solidipes]
MSLSLSWREFLVLRFPSHPRVVDLAPTHTIPYSANIPPEPEDFLRQSGLNRTSLDRALLPLEAFMKQRGILDDPVPPNVTRSISTLFEEAAGKSLTNNYDVLWILQLVRWVVSQAVTALEGSLSVDQVHPEIGEMNFLTRNDDEDIKAVAAELQHPRLFYQHAKELQELQVYEPVGQEGVRAMTVKVSLAPVSFAQILRSDWPYLALASRVHLYATGKIWPLLQRDICHLDRARCAVFCFNLMSCLMFHLLLQVTYDSGEHALLVSPHYHLFDDDNPPIYDFCTPHDEGGVPLLAVLTSLLLPDVVVDTIILPALINPLKTRSSSISIRSQGSLAPFEEAVIVDVGQTQDLKIASIPAALLFYVAHSGASAAPRTVFRYESLYPVNDVSSPPLSPSGAVVSSPPSSWSVTISREIHRGNFSRVWRGTLSDGSCTSPLVVKMYPRRHFDVMKKELKAYQYLYSHQLFNITPAYYGAFAMPDQYWAAIILADGGESGRFVGCSWKDAGLNPHELRIIWNHCKALHSIGMVHHDLLPRNITRDAKGVLRIIDFESASYDHSCSFQVTSCSELRSLARQFDSFAEGWRK